MIAKLECGGWPWMNNQLTMALPGQHPRDLR